MVLRARARRERRRSRLLPPPPPLAPRPFRCRAVELEGRWVSEFIWKGEVCIVRARSGAKRWTVDGALCSPPALLHCWCVPVGVLRPRNKCMRRESPAKPFERVGIRARRAPAATPPSDRRMRRAPSRRRAPTIPPSVRTTAKSSQARGEAPHSSLSGRPPPRRGSRQSPSPICCLRAVAVRRKKVGGGGGCRPTQPRARVERLRAAARG